ncbi:MAG: hypothetical protein LW717_17330 [Chloroflexaceae bacterium]|jgi:hypothetical protein|nr:hypothetical protein [Chloroflexaceae bacterium]MCE2852926.1 hypothetical protein [Chloroflexaceae bacterium]
MALMYRFGVTLLILPVAVLLSTVLMTSVQWLWPLTALPSWILAAGELAGATGIVWAMTQADWSWRTLGVWRDVVRACAEGWLLIGVAMIVAHAFDMLAIAPVIHWSSLWPVLVVALPLAGWCMAEEVVLRVVLPRTSPITQRWRNALLVWVLAVATIWVLSTPASWFAVAAIAAGELLSVVTRFTAQSTTTLWARRWAWRWLMICVCGATQLGIAVSTPHVISLVIPEALVPAIVTMSALIAWSAVSALPAFIQAQSSPQSPSPQK